MNNIPKSLNEKMNGLKEYTVCCLADYHQCGGRITREHALYYAGRQLQELGAIIPLCAKGHGVDQYQGSKQELPKDQREWVALHLVDLDELQKKYPKGEWQKRKALLVKRYGHYERKRFSK